MKEVYLINAPICLRCQFQLKGDWNRSSSVLHLTQVVFVGRVSGQIPQQAGERPELHVAIGAQQI